MAVVDCNSPSRVRETRWEEINFAEAHGPSLLVEMKMRREHTSRYAQALAFWML
jgi:hypothetical protein